MGHTRPKKSGSEAEEEQVVSGNNCYAQQPVSRVFWSQFKCKKHGLGLLFTLSTWTLKFHNSA